MRCPRCGADTRVFDSRHHDGQMIWDFPTRGSFIRRRRRCVRCYEVFSTEERYVVERK